MSEIFSHDCDQGDCASCSGTVAHKDGRPCDCSCHDEPECACRQIDVDMLDNRDCPLHGPDSELARRQKQQEAQAIWDFYNRMPEP